MFHFETCMNENLIAGATSAVTLRPGEIAMFQRLIERAKCMIGVHRRSRRHTEFKGRGGDTSICRHCSRPMRSTPAGWIIDKSR